MLSLDTVLDELAHEVAWDPDLGLSITSLSCSVSAGKGASATEQLQAFIYRRYYTFERTSTDRTDVEIDRLEMARHREALRRAVGKRCYWETGWRAVGKEEGRLRVTNGRVTICAASREIAPAEDGALLLRLPCARPRISSGFFYFMSPRGPAGDSVPLLRLYLNLTPRGAVSVVRALFGSRVLRDRPFEGKMVDDPRRFDRFDCGVLYLRPADFGPLYQLLMHHQAAHPKHWREGTPLFALPLARGLAAAESPGPDRTGVRMGSFGQHRAGLLARAVHRSLTQQLPPKSWKAEVCTSFRAGGTSVDAPWSETLRFDPLSKTFTQRS